MPNSGKLPLYCLDGQCAESVSGTKYPRTSHRADERVIQFAIGKRVHRKTSTVFGKQDDGSLYARRR